MNKFTAAIAVLLALTPAARAADLVLSVVNITDPGGTLYWSIFDSAEGYKSDTGAVMSARSRVDGDSLRVTLHGLAGADYAVKLFHDANDNGELDANMIGIPTEGYGFSNNAGRFGPASFEDAKFTLDGNTAVEIRLR